MKRIFVTILAVLYMAGAMGATVHIHYCMDKVMSASLMDTDADRCERCGMKKEARKKGCCKDEHKTLKTNTHQLAKASFDVASHQLSILPAGSFISYSARVPQLTISASTCAHAPPSLWRTCPIYIQVQNFRI